MSTTKAVSFFLDVVSGLISKRAHDAGIAIGTGLAATAREADERRAQVESAYEDIRKALEKTRPVVVVRGEANTTPEPGHMIFVRYPYVAKHAAFDCIMPMQPGLLDPGTEWVYVDSIFRARA